MRLRDWIEPKRSREAGLALWRGWQVHWGVNCLGVQWVYSDHIQRAFSSRSFKSKCVKGARGGICINGISWGFPRWSVEQWEKKSRKKKQLPHTAPPHPNLRFGRFLNKPKFPQILNSSQTMSTTATLLATLLYLLWLDHCLSLVGIN